MKTIGDLAEAAGRGLMAPRVMKIVARRKTYDISGETWVDQLEYVTVGDDTLLSDVLLVSGPGTGRTPKLFDGWFGVHLTSGKNFRGPVSLRNLIMEVRRRTLGPMGRDEEYYVYQHRADKTAMTLYFYDEVDAIDVRMMLDEMAT